MARRMRFKTWCAKDPDDTHKINFTFKSNNRIYYFTSEEEIDLFLFLKVQDAWIKNIEFDTIKEEWYVVLYED